MASNPLNPDFKLGDALFELGKMSRKAADKVRAQAEAAQEGAEAGRQDRAAEDERAEGPADRTQDSGNPDRGSGA